MPDMYYCLPFLEASSLNQCVIKGDWAEGPEGESAHVSLLAPGALLTILWVHCLADASLQSLPSSLHGVFPSFASLYPTSPLYKSTGHTGVGPILLT